MLALSTTPSKLWLLACIAVTILSSNGGCGKFQSGGGSRSIVEGGKNFTAAYGFTDAKKLGFVIFSDISGVGTVGSGGSTWSGNITPKTGQSIRYQKKSGGLDINGTQYQFSNGKVFLVSNQNDKISVTQLSIPVGDALYDAEIDKIKKTDEVQRFLVK